MSRENPNTALRGGYGDTIAIHQALSQRTEENRKRQFWANHAAFLINTYKNFLNIWGDKVIEFGDLRCPNSSGWFSRFNARLYNSESKPTEYRVRFMADGEEGYFARSRKVTFKSAGNTLVMVEADEQFFVNADGINFRDYLARCRVREIRTLQKCQKLG
ncbi:MAG: hypothetical protein ACLGJC_18390 [Alphaproteobacteria bacterium]